MIAAFVSFALSVVGLIWCWRVVHRQHERERERFTQEEIRRMKDRAA